MEVLLKYRFGVTKGSHFINLLLKFLNSKFRNETYNRCSHTWFSRLIKYNLIAQKQKNKKKILIVPIYKVTAVNVKV